MSETIHTLPGAVLLAHRNEVSLDEKVGENDAVKFRLGGRLTGSGYLGAISGDYLDPNGVRREKAFLAFKVDPDPCVEIWCQRSADTHEDADMIRVARFSVAGNELGGGGGSTSPGSSLHSPNGRYHAVLQDDGNLVVYDSSPGFWQALWSWFTGTL